MGALPVMDPDAEEFLSKVDEISSLIDGLKKGTVAPEVRALVICMINIERDQVGDVCLANSPQTIEYIDRKKKEEAEEKRRKEEEERKEKEASKFDNLDPEKQRELKEKACCER